ncbi:PRD domain-containing protein [Microbacterium sp. NPDC096154]|uniref:BglG family transcription antiterminator n=1 Tax=Microbacterium sp. NPDC096154 TaxID=3155549 RepID=UPI00332AB9B0
MTRRRQDRMLGILMRRGDWVTASTLADQLGVTPRSVRSYVTAVNARVPAGDAVESGPAGYRAAPGAAAALRAGAEADPGTPRERLHAVVRALLDADEGIDVHETADRMHVSSATLESDLGRVRAMLSGSDLTLERSGSRVRLAGSELAQRRFVSRLAHDEMDEGAFDLGALRRAADAMAIPSDALGAFKSDLVARLGAEGFFVNEYAAADVVLHVAIAADRVAQGRALAAVHGDPEPARARFAHVIGELTRRHFGVELGEGDRLHLAALVLTRIVVPGSRDEPAVTPDPAIESAVRAAVRRAADAYLVDIAHDDFVERLALHVQNLVHRAREQAWSRNPLTRSLKSTYPMIFDVAVSIASELSETLAVPIRDDEIAYIAMHVGGRLERSRRSDTMLTATIVCPGYYELHELLRSSVDRSLGRSIEVTGVETRVDPDWDAIDTDLVLTTIEPPVRKEAKGPSERIVRIQPFLTDADVERVAAAASRVRRTRRLGRLRAELERYFPTGAFVRGLDATRGVEGMIRDLGALLQDQGVIGDDYVESTIERERLSSTAFTETLAVPHALRMTAARTAIAIGIGDQPVPWGDARVHAVALVAFSGSDREAFQTVFEQFVEVFGEPESAMRLVRRGVDQSSFLDELAAVIDG